MNIFHIPSWYPSSNSPNAGIFTKDLIQAYANLRPEDSLYISLWGHEDTQLRIRSLKASINAISFKMKKRHISMDVEKNLTKIRIPTFWWSNQLPFGGANQLIDRIEKSFNIANDIGDGIDIIHAHVSYPAGVIASHLSKKYNTPYIITEHFGLSRDRSFFKKDILKKEITQSYLNAAAAVTVSNFLKEELFKLNIKINSIIPNVINDEKFFPAPNVSNKKFIFLLMGAITYEKGVDTFIKSASILNYTNNNFEFWIAGNGPDKKHLKQLAKKLNVSKKIKWLGNISRDDAPKIFQSCNVFVLPSRYETFGVVYAEALACGKPVIASKCGGPEEFINNNNGILIEPNDSIGLAKAMSLVHENILQYDVFKIRDEFMESFSREAIVNKLDVLYKEITGK